MRNITPAISPEDWGKQHPFLPSGWNAPIKDVNPADNAVKRINENARATMPGPVSDNYGTDIDLIKAEIRRIDANGGSGGSGVVPPLYLLESVSNPTTKVYVKYGTVNGIVPTSVNSDITVSGTNGTWYIFLDATVSATTGAVSAVTVSSNTTGVTADSSTHAYHLIGTVVVASSVITNIYPALAWSQSFVACTPGDTATYHWVVA